MGLIEWFNDCNDRRWTGLFSKYNKVKGDERHAVLVQQLAALQRELEQYRQLHRIKVFQPFEKFFDPVTGQRLKQSSTSDTTKMFAARSAHFRSVFFFVLLICLQVALHLPRILVLSGCFCRASR